jgi:hypothetical protein
MPGRAFDIHVIDDIAASQGGAVTHRQLIAAGVSPATVSRWTRTGGRWQRVLPGTYLLHRGVPTVDERMHAGFLYAGSDAVLTGAQAARLYGLRNLPAEAASLPVHLLVPMEHQVKSSGFAIVERTNRLPKATHIEGFDVASLARAIFDTGRRHPQRHAIRAITLEAVQRRLLTVDEVLGEIQHGQRRWTAVMREVLVDARAGVRSVPEASLRDVILASELPEPLWNPRLETLDGAFIAEPDAYYEDLGIALELDSRKHHYSRADDYEATWHRHERYAVNRIVVHRVMPSALANDPGGVLRAIRAIRAANEGRRPPRIKVTPVDNRAS